MACIILPSETARLVYGYLMSENLNDIALQFLERSPYLTDCRQIVKSGYQFNTKLMGKNLQDLLQEYSVIHNLANKKVNLLCKTSLLYKRIKLRCESLPEILELILFWKYRQSLGGEQHAMNERSDKNLGSSFASEPSSDSDKNSNSNTCITLSSGNHSLFSLNNDGHIMQKTNVDVIKAESFHTKPLSEIVAKPKDSVDFNLKINNRGHSHETQDMKSCRNQNNSTQCVSSQSSSEFHDTKKNSVSDTNNGHDTARSVNDENCNISINGGNETGIADLCLSTSVLTIGVNSEEKNTESNVKTNEQKDLHNSHGDYDSQIKIVRIEKEDQNENHAGDTYSTHETQCERNITLDDGSVVYVSPDMGNVTIDQERNQIIVIPIEYYKSHTETQSKTEDNGNQPKNTYYNPKDLIEVQEKHSLLYENTLPSADNPITQFCSEEMNKSSTVDGNIMTENDYLKNKQLMFDIGKDFNVKTKGHLSSQHQGKVMTDVTPIQTVSTPLIVLSQAVVPTQQPPRYRSILPKKSENSVPSVVIVQPLVDATQSVLKNASSHVDSSRKKESRKPMKKKVPLVQKCKNKSVQPLVQESFDMPSIKTPRSEKTRDESKSEESEVLILECTEPIDVEDVTSKLPAPHEEKENLQKTEAKKIETPVLVTRRNSKRLSLSTPRRRSHIRALEFETPPKTKEEKKSRTSPKVRMEKSAVERKSVRNTLFKSPVPEILFKSPETVNNTKKCSSKNDSSQDMGVQPLNESSIPIATRSPNTKLSDAWEDLTGVSCVIGQSENAPPSAMKKMWDADLRCFLGSSNQDTATSEKKRIRKPEKIQKDNRKNIKRKAMITKKCKALPTMISPSKMSLTSKRNTYSINGNEEGSPLRSLLDDLKIVTPFKDIETIRPTEETPLTKLLRENINTIDIDLSMINTPSFPPTPSILITPDLDDMSLIGANYYSPSKDFSKDKLVKITDYICVDGEKPREKNDPKEAHKKVIGDLVSKAREIIGIGKENQDDCAMKRRPSGKILSMVKIQMLTQCDKKLCENIPINEDRSFANGAIDKSSSNCCSPNEEGTKSDLKGELEEKRKRALRKIKVKENLNQSKNSVVTRNRKRKRSGFSSSSSSGKKLRRTRSDAFNETTGDKQTSWSDESDRKEFEVFHSTPYDPKKSDKFKKQESEKKERDETLSDIRQELPPFRDDLDAYSELTEKSRKKIHYVGHFLKLEEISKFLNEFNEDNPPKLYLKPSFRRFFQVFYKWLKHPHKRELNASAETKLLLQNYLIAFNKINIGVNHRNKNLKKTEEVEEKEEEEGKGGRKREFEIMNSADKGPMSDDEEKDWRNKGGTERKKDEETEDGFVSILPLKKRKQTVQHVETKKHPEFSCRSGSSSKHESAAENVSQTHNFLQDIDVDRFLSQIHGQSNR